MENTEDILGGFVARIMNILRNDDELQKLFRENEDIFSELSPINIMISLDALTKNPIREKNLLQREAIGNDLTKSAKPAKLNPQIDGKILTLKEQGFKDFCANNFDEEKWLKDNKIEW